jgi:hypothetical protein
MKRAQLSRAPLAPIILLVVVCIVGGALVYLYRRQ